MILAVTGHRPPRLGGYIIPNPVATAVIQGLSKSLDSLLPTTVITGMALGTEQWTAQLCVEKRIPFIAAVPVHGYESRWLRESKDNFYRLLRLAVQVRILHPGPYHPSLLHQKNEWMVDNSDRLLAVWDRHRDGGTAACVRYALQKGKRVDCLNLPDYVWMSARVHPTGHRDGFRSSSRERNPDADRRILVDWAPPNFSNTATALVKKVELRIPLVKKMKPTLITPRATNRLNSLRFIEVGEEN